MEPGGERAGGEEVEGMNEVPWAELGWRCGCGWKRATLASSVESTEKIATSSVSYAGGGALFVLSGSVARASLSPSALQRALHLCLS